MRYATIQSWSFANESSTHVPIDFYIDLIDSAKKAPSLEQAVRQAANRLNQLLFPRFQFKVNLNTASNKKTRHIKVNSYGCNAELGAREDNRGNKYGYISCFIGGGWRGNWKTHNVDSIIHELFHALGRFHEQQQSDSSVLIQKFNSHDRLPSENFLEFYDPFSLMHYPPSLINRVVGESTIASKPTVIARLTHQGYPQKLALNYYDTLLGLDENHFNWDAFNLGFGLLTRRDFNTLHKTACIIDPKWCEFEATPIPLFAFTTRYPKLSYHYLLTLTKIFTHPHYQKEKLIVIADSKTLEIKSNQCYKINLNQFFQVYPKIGIHCDVITSIIPSIAMFSHLDFPRKENNSCILELEKGFFNDWPLSAIQSKIIFYSNDTVINVSSTLHWEPTFTESPMTLYASSRCVSIPNNFFNVAHNKTTLPFLNSEAVPGSYLDFHERNKYFFRLGLNAVPFFAVGLITGITNRAERVIFSDDNENLSNTARYLNYLTQGIIFFIQSSLSSYTLYRHIIEEKARQLLIPLLDENKQLFQTADLMDRLNHNESFLTLVLPYGINAATLLLSTYIRSVHQHPITQLGLTQSLSLLIACFINHANTYSHLELAIGIGLYLGGTLLGASLTAAGLSFFSKVRLHCSTRHKEEVRTTSFIGKTQEIAPSCSPTVSSISVIAAMKQAWNTVTFSKFTTARSRTSFFTRRTTVESAKTKWPDFEFEMEAMNPTQNLP